MVIFIAKLARTVTALLFLFVYANIAWGAIDPNALYTDKDHPQASDDNDGRYTEDGGTGPFKTIQKLVDSLRPGMTGYVRQSQEPYFENDRKSGAPFSGVTFVEGGFDGSPITLAGFPGETPVINQRLASDDSVGNALAGIYVHSGDFITIRNFEITNTRVSGIFTSSNSRVKGIIIENNHIHHLFGADNVGGIRLDNCDECVVRNNEIHHIYDTRRDSNGLDNEPFGLHSGIHGYRPANCIIENNLIYHLRRGIYQKHPNDVGGNSHIVRRNIIKDVDVALSGEVAGSNAPTARNFEFYENLVINADDGIDMKYSFTVGQSSGLTVYNNTYVNGRSFVRVRSMTGVSVFNNIIIGSTFYPIVSEFPSTASTTGFRTEFDYIDHNVYSDNANIAFFNRNSSPLFQYRDLASFKSAFSADRPIGLLSSADRNSLEVSRVEFENSEALNYRVSSPDVTSIGRGGVYSLHVGAYGLSGQIGILAAAAAAAGAGVAGPAPPKPPSSISIQ